MCAIIKTYELYLVETGELLSDKLTLEKATELYKAYENFYGVGSVYMCQRNNAKTKHKHCSTANAFKSAWVDYFGELQSMGNLL